jgi:hypothetical protein|tara:strand:- start:20641 stop:22554 length:1914 start_codon:yes stop_codon:yes gene_type:complete
MAIEDDFSIAANGDIRHVSGSTTYTVLEFHRYLAAHADDTTSSGDDILDITTDVTQAPSTRNFDTIIVLNGNYNIDDTAAQYLYGGSISQNGGNTLYSGLQIIGSVNNSSTALQVIQNNAKLTSFWGDQSSGGYNGDSAAGILARFLVKTRDAGSDIDGKRVRVQARHWGDSFDFFNATLGVGENVAALSTQADGQNDTAVGIVGAYTHVTNTEGFQTIDLNNGNGAQEYYSQWTFGADTSGDGLKGMYEYVKYIQRTGTSETIHGINGELFLGITHSWVYDGESGGPFTEDETLSWGSGSSAGTGLLLALDDDGTTGNMYIQLLTGVAPTDNETITGGTSSAICSVNGTPTSRTVPKSSLIGNYTGSLVGAYGVGVDSGDLSSSDQVTDLSGTTQQPPNNVTIQVSGVVSGEDYVLVGRDRGDHHTLDYDNESGGPFTLGESLSWPSGTGSLEKLTDGGTTGSMEIRLLTGVVPTDNETITGGSSSATADTNGTPESKAFLETDTYSLAAGNTSGNGTLLVKETISNDEPSSGFVRVWNATNTSFDRYAYTSFSGSTFTLSGTLSQSYVEDDDCFVPFIDEAVSASSVSNTIVYSSNIDLVGTVRDGGSTPIVPFPITGTLTSSGFSVSAVRQADV